MTERLTGFVGVGGGGGEAIGEGVRGGGGGGGGRGVVRVRGPSGTLVQHVGGISSHHIVSTAWEGEGELTAVNVNSQFLEFVSNENVSTPKLLIYSMNFGGMTNCGTPRKTSHNFSKNEKERRQTHKPWAMESL